MNETDNQSGSEAVPAKSRWHSQIAWNRKNPEARRAHHRVHQAVKRGTLIPERCEDCGSPHTEAHHDDYSQPLVVRWKCRLHHRQEHRKLKQ